LPHDLTEYVDTHPGVGGRLHPTDRQVAFGCDALDDVAIGREVVTVDDDLAPLRVLLDLMVDGGADQLVEQHRRGVTHRRLPWCCTCRGGADPVAEGERCLEPLL